MSKGRVLGALVGLAISIGAGYFSLRHVSLNAVWKALREAHYWYIAPALATMSVGVVLRVQRWRAMFPRDERPGFSATFWALVLGLFANNVLPARLGEVARMAALARETGLRRTQVLTTIAVERVFDLAALGLIAAVTLPLAPSGSLRRNLTIATVVIFAAFVTLLAGLTSARVRALGARTIRRIPVLGGARGERTIGSLRAGIDSLRDRRTLAIVMGWSLASWIALSVSNYFVLSMFNTGAPWHAAVISMLATNLAMVVPSSAASIGVFEVAARASLTLYGVPAALALSFALVLHAVNVIPTLPLGGVALARVGISGRELVSGPEQEPLTDDPAGTGASDAMR
ncbi:MAG: glycosyltransferase 2 family protein [Gaiellales bacterium]|nr:glycosyltransferase 2 family protein [Gaiellales bacterium]